MPRREVATGIERLPARMGNIRLSEAHHGPEGAAASNTTYVLHALGSLRLEFNPI
ncbi:MAG: hypothetical protein P8Y58_05080 [Novosphingobium sp.]